MITHNAWSWLDSFQAFSVIMADPTFQFFNENQSSIPYRKRVTSAFANSHFNGNVETSTVVGWCCGIFFLHAIYRRVCIRIDSVCLQFLLLRLRVCVDRIFPMFAADGLLLVPFLLVAAYSVIAWEPALSYFFRSHKHMHTYCTFCQHFVNIANFNPDTAISTNLQEWICRMSWW